MNEGDCQPAHTNLLLTAGRCPVSSKDSWLPRDIATILSPALESSWIRAASPAEASPR